MLGGAQLPFLAAAGVPSPGGRVWRWQDASRSLGPGSGVMDALPPILGGGRQSFARGCACPLDLAFGDQKQLRHVGSMPPADCRAGPHTLLGPGTAMVTRPCSASSGTSACWCGRPPLPLRGQELFRQIHGCSGWGRGWRLGRRAAPKVS